MDADNPLPGVEVQEEDVMEIDDPTWTKQEEPSSIEEIFEDEPAEGFQQLYRGHQIRTRRKYCHVLMTLRSRTLRSRSLSISTDISAISSHEYYSTLDYAPEQPLQIRWGEEGSQSTSNLMITSSLVLFNLQPREFIGLGKIPFIVVHIGVDAVIELPLLKLLKHVSIDWAWEITASYHAAHLRGFGKPSSRFTQPKKIWVECSSKRFDKDIKCNKYLTAWRIQPEEVNDHYVSFHIARLHAKGKQRKGEDTADNGRTGFLKVILDRYDNTLFTESSEFPPDQGEDNFSIELLPGAKPLAYPFPWGAQIVFAKKKDGGLRVCLDYQGLNAITKKDRTPLPNLQEMQDHVAGAKFFTSIDIKDAYHWIRINPSDVEKTAIRTRFGHFEYLVMPFGLTNAPAAFQRLINKILGPHYDDLVLAYLDDILVFSKTMEEHRKHVDIVLRVLTEHKLYVNPAKCMWGQPEVEFCGHIIRRNGAWITPSKIRAVQDWPELRSHHDVQRFLGLTNYFIDFIDWYAEILMPLSQLQSGKNPWQWKDEEKAAFEKIKHAITTAPILVTFDPTKDTFIFTDSSGFAIGGWLAQTTDPEYEIPSPLPKTLRELKALPCL
ncbi:hypothetical protein SpCBS45565_g08462 [Spizellomyces sp. 'palustris']|nr:hypothetical protein SpCBS45565_g08462 [Spizellomyces sp. 'palustris']